MQVLVSDAGLIFLSQCGDAGSLELGGTLSGAEPFAAKACWQLLGRGGLSSPLVEGPDKSESGRQDPIQIFWGLGPGFRSSAEKPRQKPMYVALVNMAAVGTGCASVSTGEWGSPSLPDCLLFTARQKRLTGSCWGGVRSGLGL